MKISQEKPTFKKIIIEIETQEELDTFGAVFGYHDPSYIQKGVDQGSQYKGYNSNLSLKIYQQLYELIK